MVKYLNDTGLARVWAKLKAWANDTFAPREHDHSSVRNAGSATKLEDARTISLDGAVAGSAIFDGAGNVSIPTTYTLEGPNEGTLPVRFGGTGATTAVEARKNLRIQCGSISKTITSVPVAGYTSIDVEFPTPFIYAPIIILTGASNTSGRMNGLVMNVGNLTPHGFTIDVYNPTTGASGTYVKGIHWIAVEDYR